jgi:hypothetical protein
LGLGAPLVPPPHRWVEPAPERGWGGPARRGIESHADCTHPIGGLVEWGGLHAGRGLEAPAPPRPFEGKCAWSLPRSPIEDALEMGGPGMPRVATSARRQWGEGVDKW